MHALSWVSVWVINFHLLAALVVDVTLSLLINAMQWNSYDRMNRRVQVAVALQ